MRKAFSTYWFLALVAGVIVILDQITKVVVRQNLTVGQAWAPWDWMLPFVRIIHWQNTGVAFGMFQGMGTVFAILAAMVSVGLIYYYPRVPKKDWIMRLALGMMLAGALGNLIDRIYQGHVTDFISVGTFAVFNVADSSITVGVIVLFLGIYFEERRNKPKLIEGEVNQPVDPDPHEAVQ